MSDNWSGVDFIVPPRRPNNGPPGDILQNTRSGVHLGEFRERSASPPRSARRRGRSICDLPSIQLIPGFGTLQLDYKSICSFEGLGSPEGLDTLYMNHNHIESFEFFEVHTDLKELHLDYNNIQSFFGLQKHPKLAVVTMTNNPICAVPDYRMLLLLAVGPALRKVDDRFVSSDERKEALAYGSKVAQDVREGLMELGASQKGRQTPSKRLVPRLATPEDTRGGYPGAHKGGRERERERDPSPALSPRERAAAPGDEGELKAENYRLKQRCRDLESKLRGEKDKRIKLEKNSDVEQALHVQMKELYVQFDNERKGRRTAEEKNKIAKRKAGEMQHDLGEMNARLAEVETEASEKTIELEKYKNTGRSRYDLVEERLRDRDTEVSKIKQEQLEWIKLSNTNLKVEIENRLRAEERADMLAKELNALKREQEKAVSGIVSHPSSTTTPQASKTNVGLTLETEKFRNRALVKEKDALQRKLRNLMTQQEKQELGSSDLCAFDCVQFKGLDITLNDGVRNENSALSVGADGVVMTLSNKVPIQLAYKGIKVQTKSGENTKFQILSETSHATIGVGGRRDLVVKTIKSWMAAALGRRAEGGASKEHSPTPSHTSAQSGASTRSSRVEAGSRRSESPVEVAEGVAARRIQAIFRGGRGRSYSNEIRKKLRAL